jgi:hypothetical protein
MDNQKLTQFNEARVKALRQEIDAALAPIAKKYGLEGLSLRRITYGPAEFRSSIEVKLANTDSEAYQKRMMDLSKVLGFSESLYGRFVYGSDGKKYKIIDINTKKRKYPLVGECVTDADKKLLFSVNTRFEGEQPKKLIPNFNRHFR